MVVPHSTGQLVRSMVRIPGSGSDRQAHSICLDLSNVSSLAATIPLSRTLPQAFLRPQSPPVKSVEMDTKHRSMETSAEAAPRPVTRRKRSLPQKLLEDAKQTGPSAPSAPKVSRMAPAPAQSLQIQISLTQTSTPNQTLQVFVLPGTVLQTVPVEHQALNGSMGFNGDSCSTISATQALQLHQEVEQLKKQNKALIERVTKFQNIFKDKKCLQHIANRLLAAPVPAK